LKVESLEDRLVPSTFNVNGTADNLNPVAGTVTLRSAIQAANHTPGGNTINLTVPGTYKITLPGTPWETDNAAGEFAILPGGDLTIVNTSGGTVVVDANHLARAFDIDPTFNANNPPPRFTVTLQGFTIQNGFVTDQANPDGPNASGAGIRDVGNASLTLTNMVITNNSASADGGGIVNENTVSTPWTLTVNNSLISNNHAGDAGGGIDTDGSGNVVINAGTVITGNTSVNQGAGIWLDAIQAGAVFQTANLTVTGAIISGNAALTAGNVGGGIGNAGNGTVTIMNSTLANNYSGGVGGGFGDENAQGTLTVQNSLFVGNSAFGNGGGIAAGGPTTTITNTEIKGNSSGGSGGGLFANGGALMVTSATVAANTAAVGGGGIELELPVVNTGLPQRLIVDTTITGNSALNNAGANGGGIDAPFAFMGGVGLVNDTINANFATTGGGVFWAAALPSTFGIANTIVAGNVAGTGPDITNSRRLFADNGGNLIGITDGATGFTTLSQTGTAAHPLDPLLGTLQNNGGPTIGAPGNTITLETEALLPGSPAVGNGTMSMFVTPPTNDERGLAHVINGRIDVGAFEVQPLGPTATVLTSSLNPAQVGQAITLTATVSPTAAGFSTPTGSVTFRDGTTNLGSATLNNGVATLTTSALAAGMHSITASYGGVATGVFSFVASTSAAVNQAVAQPLAPTATALTSSLNPAPVGQAVTFTATVTAVAPGFGTPTGSVTFFDGTTSLGSATLNNGVATLTTSALAAGMHSITASYGGVTTGVFTFTGSTSTAVSQAVVQPVVATTTALASSLNPAPLAQGVTFTATVSATGSGATPIGSVTFFDGTTSLGTATLSNGAASLTTSALAVGSHSITASYGGITGGVVTFSSSASTALTQTVVQPVTATTTVLASSLNPARPGQAITFTATVSASGSGATPTGSVTFFDGTTSLGSATLSNGAATLTTTTLGIGKHSITATYNGGTQGIVSFTASTSVALVETVRFTYFAVGGAPGRVQVRRDSDGALVADFAPYGPGYTGPVTVAVGDVNGDGVPDLVTGAALGNPDVRVWDGLALENGSFNAANPNGSLLAQFFPYALNFNVGVNVAVGDIEKDGFADLVTGPTGGNPDVRVYRGKDIATHTFNPNGASLVAQWFAYGVQFNIGANVAVGDVNGDGYADVVTGATAGNPEVRVYNGKDIATGHFNPTGASLLAQFFAFGLQFNIGAFVAVGDVNGDGFGDVIVGASSGNPQVKVYDGKAITNGSFQPANPDAHLLDQFLASNSLSANVGASVAAADFEGTGMFDILTGTTKGPPTYRVVKGTPTGILPAAVNGIDAIATDLTGGLFVGG
jgi:hypothetical protein